MPSFYKNNVTQIKNDDIMKFLGRGQSAFSCSVLLKRKLPVRKYSSRELFY